MASRRKRTPPETESPARNGNTVVDSGDSADSDQLLARLSELVIDRYARLTGQLVVTIPVDLPAHPSAWRIPDPPHHPNCADLPCSDYCRRKWRWLLGRLRRRPEIHWHRCKFGRLCAMVPVVWFGRCLAVCQLVAVESKDEDAFEREVELLDVLVENYLAREADLVARVMSSHAAPAEAAPSPSSCCSGARATPGMHRKVVGAINYIDQHLDEPSMTVADIARHLGTNPSYLAHLFAQQVHVRMSNCIAQKRITLASQLLADTDWQIKRVARASGHANADWFSHVFHLHAGMTPTEYRRVHRGRSRSS